MGGTLQVCRAFLCSRREPVARQSSWSHRKKAKGAPGRPRARHRLQTISCSSVLQNGCSSAFLNRLSHASGRKHSYKAIIASHPINVRCALADSRQQESLCQAVGRNVAPGVPGKLERARLQDLQRPGITRWRRGAVPARRALLPCGDELGASSPARTSAGSWSRRRAEGPAARPALDSRASILRYGARCCEGCAR